MQSLEKQSGMEKEPFKDQVSLCFVLMTHYFSGKEGHCLLNHQQNGSKLWFQTACRTWGHEGEQGDRAFSRWFLRILAIRRTCSVCKKGWRQSPCTLSTPSLSFSISVQVPLWFLWFHVTAAVATVVCLRYVGIERPALHERIMLGTVDLQMRVAVKSNWKWSLTS